MKKLLIAGILCVVLVSCVAVITYDNHEEIEENVEEVYQEKEILYAPIECFLNETHYDTKCVEDYVNGN